MNRDWTLYNLSEAREELERALTEIRETPDYGVGELLVTMSHVYHHLNTAWNSRNSSESEIRHPSPENFKRWSAFPVDIAPFE
jgi:hypothetical protein